MTEYSLEIILFSVQGETFTTEIEVESPEISEETVSEIAANQSKVKN